VDTVMQNLVEQYIPLANKLAFQRKKTLPRHVDIEDLRSAAYLGLVEAASRFDKTLKVAFVTYAYYRIVGAIGDFLRQEHFVMRSLDDTVEEDGVPLKDLIPDHRTSNHGEFFDIVSESFGERAADILKGYFFGHRSMRELAEEHGITEGRISQLIKNYEESLRQDWSYEDLERAIAA
jgi:RNA polymerase sigma factor (sigma-70 family)